MWDADLIHRRLAEIRRQDPERKFFGAQRHHHRLGPRLSTRQVTAFETKVGVELPESFRTFLTEVGNGGAGPSYGLYDIEEAFRLDAMETHAGPPHLYASPFPHTASWNPPLEAQPADYEESRWITGSLVLAEFGCGAFHRLVVSGEIAGEVWFDDRCADDGIVRELDFYEWYMTWLDHPQRHLY
ncbi:SMI1/KNR4 family protein [Sphaerisporangium album]|uniref:SMI1/KNR4 family protein n=1 Tax=Sphaerisporangium album TaxID=509200 RepID=A0A367FGX1_9ACTN|nr:SMI1/KNR4 family protein [Sphaerisporangium album]RCG29082.1 SMI1/KNR4 family protein [Sphaerisporangium album]